MANFLERITGHLRPRSAAPATSAVHAPLSTQVFRYLSGPRSRLDQHLAVGQIEGSEQLLHLTPRQRNAHLYCAGITGSGKTRWLQHLICADISLGQSVVVLDPFGGLYRAVREFVATGIEQAMVGGFDRRELLARYRFLDLNDPDNPLQINPLAQHPPETVEQQVGDLMKAAIFDLLRKDDLQAADIDRIKADAVELLATLKAEKLRVDQWREKEATRDAGKGAIHDFLYSDATGPPVEAYEEAEVQERAAEVFQHIFRAYPSLPSPFYEQRAGG